MALWPLGQREPGPLQPSEPAGLQEHGQAKEAMASSGVEVAGDERLGDRPDGGRRRAARLLAAPKLPGRTQLQDCCQMPSASGSVWRTSDSAVATEPTNAP